MPVAAKVRELLWGDKAVLVDMIVPAGFEAQLHAHDHESVVYVISGPCRRGERTGAKDARSDPRFSYEPPIMATLDSRERLRFSPRTPGHAVPTRAYQPRHTRRCRASWRCAVRAMPKTPRRERQVRGHTTSLRCCPGPQQETANAHFVVTMAAVESLRLRRLFQALSTPGLQDVLAWPPLCKCWLSRATAYVRSASERPRRLASSTHSSAMDVQETLSFDRVPEGHGCGGRGSSNRVVSCRLAHSLQTDAVDGRTHEPPPGGDHLGQPQGLPGRAGGAQPADLACPTGLPLRDASMGPSRRVFAGNATIWPRPGPRLLASA